MDLGFCGIIDIVLVVLLLLFWIIGYKKGFAKKIISFASIILIAVFAFFFCTTVAGFIISNNVFNLNTAITNWLSGNFSLEGNELIANETGVYKVVLSKIAGFPEFLANWFANGAGRLDAGAFDGTVYSGSSVITFRAASEISLKYATYLFIKVIAFFAIVIAVIIVLAILKAIVNSLREGSKAVKVIDGFFGIILYSVLFAAIVLVLFFGLSFLMDHPEWEWFSGIRNWITVDMQLDTEKFRLSKYLYQGNFLRRIIDFFM